MTEFKYTFSHECSVDLLASPYGLGALSVIPLKAPTIGVGSVYLNATVLVHAGKLYFNDGADFDCDENIRYRIVVYVEKPRTLRIDFFKYKMDSPDNVLDMDAIGTDTQDMFTTLPTFLNGLKEKDNWNPAIVFRGEIGPRYPTDFEMAVGVLKFAPGPSVDSR
ncbi:unnamed protein product [Kuraishia capsulata CBS 1993]|uniref:Uncharacterized protein n=1 Tax=Kuraishia capsulata CBS 1993 TaxID=1382522 RepID=W6MK05_9ASCO|nr:uncharacterized protein KUCA_T00002294001 [Kuraishia capsulata CBS 1993]CDK26323.1 unnamed protein product [Kuraishia capsulata CBS 1993]